MFLSLKIKNLTFDIICGHLWHHDQRKQKYIEEIDLEYAFAKVKIQEKVEQP